MYSNIHRSDIHARSNAEHSYRAQCPVPSDRATFVAAPPCASGTSGACGGAYGTANTEVNHSKRCWGSKGFNSTLQETTHHYDDLGIGTRLELDTD